jgi:valyl-tRNA synthetase
MPHITDEIWHMLPGVDPDAFLDYSDWPVGGERDESAESEMARNQEIVRAIRSLRQDAGITPKQTLPLLFASGDNFDAEIVRSQTWFGNIDRSTPEGASVGTVAEGVEFKLPLAGLIDKGKELARLDREEEKISRDLDSTLRRLNNPEFTHRAKPEVVQRDRQTAGDLQEKLAKLAERRDQIKALP